MSTNELSKAPSGTDLKVLEAVVVGGDLSKLNTADRLTWYKARCEAAGLDPFTKPFDYITLNGKLTLYATKTATDQLIAKHHLTVTIIDRQALADLGIYEVLSRVTRTDGTTVDDVGVVSIAGLRGELLCNAILKAVTKSKRRTVLSACGLGMMDESEVESAAVTTEPTPEERRVEPPRASPPERPPLPDNGSGHGSGAYASPIQVQTFRKAFTSWLERRNAEWLDKWANAHTNEWPNGLKAEPVNYWQAKGHMLKWAIQTQRLDPVTEPEKTAHDKVEKLLALVYHRDRRSFGVEAEHYYEAQAELAIAAWREKHPELDPDGGDDPPLEVDDEPVDERDDYEPVGTEREPGSEG